MIVMNVLNKLTWLTNSQFDIYLIDQVPSRKSQIPGSSPAPGLSQIQNGKFILPLKANTKISCIIHHTHPQLLNMNEKNRLGQITFTQTL